MQHKSGSQVDAIIRIGLAKELFRGIHMYGFAWSPSALFFSQLEEQKKLSVNSIPIKFSPNYIAAVIVWGLIGVEDFSYRLLFTSYRLSPSTY